MASLAALAEYRHLGAVVTFLEVSPSEAAELFSEFERAIIRERVAAGRDRAREQGTKSGKPFGHPRQERRDAFQGRIVPFEGVLLTLAPASALLLPPASAILGQPVAAHRASERRATASASATARR